MNWGHKITLVIIIFIITMLAMVFVAFKQTNEMVDSNYYEKELKYQSLIDAAHNLNAVSNEVILSKNPDGLLVTIPMALTNNFENGTIEFLRNDDEKKDITLSFKPDSQGLFLIHSSKVSPGSYKVRIKWDSDKKSYYREQNLMLEN